MFTSSLSYLALDESRSESHGAEICCQRCSIVGKCTEQTIMAVFCAPLIFEDLYGLWILEANLRHVYSVLGLFSSNYLGIYLA